MTIHCLKHFYVTPLNLLVSSVVSPHSFNRSSHLRSLSPGMNGLVALLCILSSISMSFLAWMAILLNIVKLTNNLLLKPVEFSLLHHVMWIKLACPKFLVNIFSPIKLRYVLLVWK